jgi:hypothetical protein
VESLVEKEGLIGVLGFLHNWRGFGAGGMHFENMFEDRGYSQLLHGIGEEAEIMFSVCLLVGFFDQHGVVQEEEGQVTMQTS